MVRSSEPVQVKFRFPLLTAVMALGLVAALAGGCGGGGGTGEEAPPPPAPDTTPPPSPGLVAQPLSQSNIVLSWSLLGINVPDLAGFRLYRNGLLINTGMAQQFTDSNLATHTQYCYQVTAYDNAGNESQSTKRCATTTWKHVIVDNGGGPVLLRLTSEGVPRIVYVNPGRPDQPLVGGVLKQATKQGAQWLYEDIYQTFCDPDLGCDHIGEASFAIDGLDASHIVFTRWASAFSTGDPLYYAKRDSYGQWTSVNLCTGCSAPLESISLAAGASRLHLSFAYVPYLWWSSYEAGLGIIQTAPFSLTLGN